MAFPTKLLNPGEAVVYDLRPHWWFMVEPTAALLGATLVGGFLVLQLDGRETWEDIVRVLGIVLIVVCLAWFVLRYLKWVTTNFVLTSDRLIYRSGVIAKTGIEIPLERVNTVFFNQTIFERMLGAGDVSIESGGETGKQTFSDIRKPSLVQNEIYRQMEANNARMYTGRTSADPVAGESVTEQLEKLGQLRASGVLTDAEFEAKKAELLKRL